MEHKSKSTPEPAARIRALINLLGDDDHNVRDIARKHLLQIGDDATDFLDEIARADSDGKTRIQARAIMEQIKREELIHAFHVLGMWRDEDIDLEKGSYLIARFAYPKLTMQEISTELDRLALRVRELLDFPQSAGQIVDAINHVLFREAGFRGSTESYYSVENSYINKVLTKRVGIPISLSLVYLLVAHRLNLPIYGVNMPLHFLCIYDQAPEPFYIDVFNKGQIMTRGECLAFMKTSGVGFRESYLERASNRDILVRMLRNLILVYYHNEQDSQATLLKKLLKILKHYA